MWKQVCAFVLATLSMQSFPEGNLELSEEDKKKLDDASKTEGFAEKFQEDYNKKLESKQKEIPEEAPDFNAFMATSEEEEEEGLTEDPPSNLSEAEQKQLNDVLAQNKLLASQNEQLKGNIAKLEKLPDNSDPETITAKLGTQMKHSKTHLFPSHDHLVHVRGLVPICLGSNYLT